MSREHGVVGLDELDPELRRLLDSERGSEATDPAYAGVERALARVQRAVNVGGGPPGGTSLPALSRKSLRPWSKALCVGSLALAAGAIPLLIWPSTIPRSNFEVAPQTEGKAEHVEAATTPAPALHRQGGTTSAPSGSGRLHDIEPVDVATLPAAPKPAASTRGPRRDTAVHEGPSAPHKGTLSEETAMIQHLHGAVERHDCAAAYAAIQEHEARFASGQLVPVRESLRIRALDDCGEKQAAREAATRFRARFPNSVLLPSVDGRKDSEP